MATNWDLENQKPWYQRITEGLDKSYTDIVGERQPFKPIQQYEVPGIPPLNERTKALASDIQYRVNPREVTDLEYIVAPKADPRNVLAGADASNQTYTKPNIFPDNNIAGRPHTSNINADWVTRDTSTPRRFFPPSPRNNMPMAPSGVPAGIPENKPTFYDVSDLQKALPDKPRSYEEIGNVHQNEDPRLSQLWVNHHKFMDSSKQDPTWYDEVGSHYHRLNNLAYDILSGNPQKAHKNELQNLVAHGFLRPNDFVAKMNLEGSYDVAGLGGNVPEGNRVGIRPFQETEHFSNTAQKHNAILDRRDQTAGQLGVAPFTTGKRYTSDDMSVNNWDNIRGGIPTSSVRTNQTAFQSPYHYTGPLESRAGAYKKEQVEEYNDLMQKIDALSKTPVMNMEKEKAAAVQALKYDIKTNPWKTGNPTIDNFRVSMYGGKDPRLEPDAYQMYMKQQSPVTAIYAGDKLRSIGLPQTIEASGFKEVTPRDVLINKEDQKGTVKKYNPKTGKVIEEHYTEKSGTDTGPLQRFIGAGMEVPLRQQEIGIKAGHLGVERGQLKHSIDQDKYKRNNMLEKINEYDNKLLTTVLKDRNLNDSPLTQDEIKQLNNVRQLQQNYFKQNVGLYGNSSGGNVGIANVPPESVIQKYMKQNPTMTRGQVIQGLSKKGAQ